jgi:hypothetical protein
MYTLPLSQFVFSFAVFFCLFLIVCTSVFSTTIFFHFPIVRRF